MESCFRMGQTLYFILSLMCSQGLTTSFNTMCGHYVFERVWIKSGYPINGNIIRTINGTDAISCVTNCHRHMACLSAILDMESQTCKLLSRVIKIGSESEQAMSVYFKRTVVPLDSVECDSDADCKVANSACWQERLCQCQLGYSYNPSDATCEAECNEYGTQFVVQSNNSCSDVYWKEKNHSTLAQCEAWCIEQTADICRSIEMEADKCYINYNTQLNMTEWSDDHPGCVYYQRSCSP